MISAYSAAAVRAAEAPLLAAGRGPELMRTAAHGLARGVAAMLRTRGRGVYGAKVVLLVGPGNNGGDALFAGAWLAARGARTTALLTGGRTHPDALAAFQGEGGRCISLLADAADPARAAADFLAEAGTSYIVVDGLLGTGGRGGLREPAAGIVAKLEQLSAGARPVVVACDLPSGVDATTGEVRGPVLRADLTVTFGAYKTGLVAAPGEQFCGEVSLVDLGLGPHLGEADVLRLESADIAALLPAPDATDQKYTRGVAGIIAGSGQYPGAGLLAAAAASACGPGMVRYLGPAPVAAAIHVRNPEVVCSQDAPPDVRVQAWLAGPGIDGDDRQLGRAREAMESGVPTVLDAAALALVCPDVGGKNALLVLTPHAGELGTLFSRCGIELDRDGIEAAPLAAARKAAQVFGANVLLKGPTTVVAAPDGTAFTQANGTARLATAGSGDTLAGILVALLAMAPSPPDYAAFAALAVALHGELASSTPVREPFNAGMLASRIPDVWGRLAASSPN
ncbi:NAD(P)H-hydrate dehydratase [Arthrobacter sp. H35-D1]|uniref:NAD(P)H-hydrate dehydratase n=1 Tax=Arthrobacter sp. H35-D1 TaxID=3046202 RepID=UPI0024B91069|nr:NAD(P)H-hydrate dehydratase [Arthrobacter sp. H35-D1]MDJ0315185.1 NAD(P)H-hydrate dehydratase [Arthrobacter sp. H35-D1]